MKFHLRVLLSFLGALVACGSLALIIDSLITITTDVGNPSWKNTSVEVQVELSSECSEKATRVGVNQKVISYSFYRGNSGDASEFKARYVPGLIANYQRIQELYPGWLMRVYTNIPEDSELLRSFSNETNLYICDVAKLPGVGNVTNIHKMVWRFLALGDPTVSTALFRDLDTLPSDREQVAVAEWEKSDKIFHAMRDSPFHNITILAGIWGVKSHLLNATVRIDLKARFIKEGLMNVGHYGQDQTLLEEILYSRYKKFFMIHDSYHCGYFKDSVPFPVQRKDVSQFVGIIINNWHAFGKGRVAKCPVLCRPSYGKDWTYC